jgi:hypothetical protein
MDFTQQASCPCTFLQMSREKYVQKTAIQALTRGQLAADLRPDKPGFSH